MATPLQTYNNSQEHKNGQKWQNATINDVAKKYGFDFSKGYANQQAEAIAAAQRNQYNAASRANQSMNAQALRDIDSNLKEGLTGTEDNFFQSYLAQRQQQANRGLNAGIQADQDTRLGMNQQKVFAGLYRDAGNNRAKEMDRFNNESLTIKEALALVEQKKLADAQKMYQDLLTQGYGILGQERGWYNQLDQQAYNRYRDALEDAQRAAAQRAARQGSPGGGSPGGTVLSPSLGNMLDTMGKQTQSPLASYYNTPAINAVERLKQMSPHNYALNKAFDAPMPPANDHNISPYDKIKMFKNQFGLY
jgi:hypothetical protein